ncbi:MAG: hypothetical protein A2751_02475 [Candidatus Doudnabacteria bacterium RIFCSPHIGHO2_01_FULL_46_14]|uniref:Uncharacterized protein n=1 Tax=Candidatus Doudnabacteria bacterium RIFCSPHIGHO2_01_FULL_46_14 TaxID=1817824 RepID=A0A1F5NJL4_9BACT|nr:MAG: hypothetical protein A2751_02475 [Candidatus Doudnabacteria bacterium RIFCSPHIGHO2_01_FULL_46_14]
MIIKLIVQTVFYILLGIHAIYSLVMVYILLHYGKSKILSLTVCALYAIIMTTLYAAALANFSALSFPDFNLYEI